MGQENNFLLFKLKRAIKKKFDESKLKSYGINNENNVVDIIQSAI